MLYGDKINIYIDKNKDFLYKRVMEIAKSNEGKEENFRTEFAIILNEIYNDLDIKQGIIKEQEYSVSKGRIDSLYGNLILEYKAPKIISKNIENNSKHIEQVKRHIVGLSEKNKIQQNKILGVVFDGFYFIYIRVINNDWDESGVIELTDESLSIFLKRLLSVSIEKKALTIENLLNDFSSKGKLSTKIITEFYNLILSNKENNKPNLLFEQWKILYREVCGYNFETLDLKMVKLKDCYKIEDENVDLPTLIFSIHTYFALIIKFLSIEVLNYLQKKSYNTLKKFPVDNSEKLKAELKKMEDGGLFKQLGIKNFLEGDFFGWYLHLWNKETYKNITELIETFNNYDYSVIDLEPEYAKDLLKNVYHNLLPKELRHNLGEYYTPDWLAEFLINEMNLKLDGEKIVLDPTCGSGTFIVLLIKKFILDNKGKFTKSEMLSKILETIKGYDLNPLAVISARANYIVALGELYIQRKNDIEIPIYLCDSMLTILEQKNEVEEKYIIGTKAANFPIPTSLVKNGIVNTFLDLTSEAIESRMNTEIFVELIKKEIPKIEEIITESDKTIINEFYSIMYELDKKGLDGIWANVIKNSFAPIFQKKVDYIIGNPPWIVWQSLPEEYRNSIKKHWDEYKVFEHKGNKARHGSSHDDISVLMTYVIMDNFLKDKGEIGFVINQNIFQAYGGGEGFRKLKIKDTIPIKIKKVHDFVETIPFKDLGSDNKTAVFIAEKNSITKFPIEYSVWRRKRKGIIKAETPLKNVLEKYIAENVIFAKPLKGNKSPWILGTDVELKIYDKMLKNDKEKNYEGRKGVDTSANGIFWVKIKEKIGNNILIENSPETSKKDIIKVENFIVEEELLYPLLRGKDVKKWEIDNKYSIILPYYKKNKCFDNDYLKINYRKTYNYFYSDNHEFEEILKNRAIYIKYLQGNPYHSVYNIGEYTFSPFKVVWKALASGMNAVTISKYENKIIIPDHNLVMVPFDDESSAYFLSGILNTEIVTNFVNAYISWFFSTHILENLNIPKYDSKNDAHNRIVELSKEAHQVVINDKKRLSEIEKELNEITKKIILQ